jgi:hypothetical protein
MVQDAKALPFPHLAAIARLNVWRQKRGVRLRMRLRVRCSNQLSYGPHICKL